MSDSATSTSGTGVSAAAPAGVESARIEGMGGHTIHNGATDPRLAERWKMSAPAIEASAAASRAPRYNSIQEWQETAKSAVKPPPPSITVGFSAEDLEAWNNHNGHIDSREAKATEAAAQKAAAPAAAEAPRKTFLQRMFGSGSATAPNNAAAVTTSPQARTYGSYADWTTTPKSSGVPAVSTTQTLVTEPTAPKVSHTTGTATAGTGVAASTETRWQKIVGGYEGGFEAVRHGYVDRALLGKSVTGAVVGGAAGATAHAWNGTKQIAGLAARGAGIAGLITAGAVGVAAVAARNETMER